MGAKLVKKITAALVAGELLKDEKGNFNRLDIEGKPASIDLYDVYGVAVGVKQSKPGAEREFVGFKGEFEATNCQTGEVFQSGVLYTHEPMTSMLLGQLLTAKEQDEAATVQFAIRTRIKKPTPGKVSATGYEFEVVSLLEVKSSSPIQLLKEAAKAEVAKLTALPAPTPAAEEKNGKKK